MKYSNCTTSRFQYLYRTSILTVGLLYPLIYYLREGGFPTVSSHTGDWVIDPSTHSLLWTAPRVSSNDETKTGTLEFSVAGDDATAFFPVKVNFTAIGSLIGINVRRL